MDAEAPKIESRSIDESITEGVSTLARQPLFCVSANHCPAQKHDDIDIFFNSRLASGAGLHVANNGAPPMVSEPFKKESFWKELDEAGEDEVRIRVATQRYGNNNNKRRLADEWLAQCERLRSSASQSEQIEIARSAKDAAWAAAEAARAAARSAKAANTRATIGLIIATISMIWTALSDFKSLFPS